MDIHQQDSLQYNVYFDQLVLVLENHYHIKPSNFINNIININKIIKNTNKKKIII